MILKLNNLPKLVRPTKRLGRGIGSGTGKTAGKGHKGQNARSGVSHRAGFEGGQMSLLRRTPKSGFRSKTKGNDSFPLFICNKVSGDLVSRETLIKAGINITSKLVKLYRSGTLHQAKKFDSKTILLTKSLMNELEVL